MKKENTIIMIIYAINLTAFFVALQAVVRCFNDSTTALEFSICMTIIFGTYLAAITELIKFLRGRNRQERSEKGETGDGSPVPPELPKS